MIVIAKHSSKLFGYVAPALLTAAGRVFVSVVLGLGVGLGGGGWYGRAHTV